MTVSKKGYQTLLLLLAFAFSNFSYAEPVVRLTSGEWPPYLSRNLPQGGFAAQVVAEAFHAMGVEVELGYYPWKRSYLYALQGKDAYGQKWHGSIVWIETEQRLNDFYYSDAVVTDEEVLFYLAKSHLHWKTINDLNGIVLGGTAHTSYPALEKADQEGILTLQRGGNYETLLKRVFHLRIDAAPMVKQVGLYYLSKSFTPQEQKQFTYSPTVLETRTYHLIFSKKLNENRALLKLFNQGLKKIRENGRYTQLLNQLKSGNY